MCRIDVERGSESFIGLFLSIFVLCKKTDIPSGARVNSISTFRYFLGVFGVSFGPKLIIVRYLQPITWKTPIFTFDLTWLVTSFGKFRGCLTIVSLRAFERRVARLPVAICSRVVRWGVYCLTSPSKSWVAKYPSSCRVKARWNIFIIKNINCRNLSG